MLGGIYADQRCRLCNRRLQDDGRKSVCCPDHPEEQATRLKVIFKTVTKRFRSYAEAQRFLTGLRFKSDEGTFDARDYRADAPLGFTTLAEKWLVVKRQTVKPRSFNNLRNYIARACSVWGNRNIKTIGFPEIEDFLQGQEVSSKTRANMKSCLNDFWTWLNYREEIPVPRMPEVKFSLAFRPVIGKETQLQLLEEVKRISYGVNPKIWLGIRWLCTYISIRPGELVQILEEHIDTENGYIFILHPKNGDFKPVPVLEEDIAIVKSLPKGFPKQPFFRHEFGVSGCTAGEPFGQRYFYKWWKKACDNLGIAGVDLYGGTRHSSAIALRKHFSPEQIKQGTMHSTNKAFERYFRIEGDDLRQLYRQSSPDKTDKGLTKKIRSLRKA